MKYVMRDFVCFTFLHDNQYFCAVMNLFKEDSRYFIVAIVSNSGDFFVFCLSSFGLYYYIVML